MLKKHTEEIIRPDLNEFGEPRSTKAVLADKRGLTTSVTESLGSIGMGIAVLGLTAVAIGAGFNFSQDSGAQQTLDSVKSAQVLVQAKTGTFGDVAALTTGQDPALTKTSPSLAIVKTDKDYCAAIKSNSMFAPSYWLTARSGKVLDAKPDAAAAGVTCPDPAAG